MKFLYLNTRFYLALLLIVILFAIGLFAPFFFYVAVVVLIALIVLITVEIFMLFHKKEGILAKRTIAERLSNGDENEIGLNVKNNYPFAIDLEIIDELPFQFQERNFSITHSLSK